MNKKIIIYISLLLSFSIALFILMPVQLHMDKTGQISLDVCKKNLQFNHLSGVVYVPVACTVMMNILESRFMKFRDYLLFLSPPVIEINKPPV